MRPALSRARSIPAPRRMLPILASVAAACCAVPASGQAGPVKSGESTVVEIDGGAVRGAATAEIRTFRGMPYAAPPVGALRWRAPQPVEAWDGVREATAFGPRCAQNADLGTGASVQEDCLTVNVYAPVRGAGERPLPVMTWIHGGTFRTGAGEDIDPTQLAVEQRVVVVTVNYRLGPFGFLSVPALRDQGEGLNFGLQDQFAALRWVTRNVGAFGGDAGRVTLFGQSAGGGSVCAALMSPKAAGLFHGAIIQSAGCDDTARPVDKAFVDGERYAATLGCPPGPTQVACLRGKPASELLAAAPAGIDLREVGWTAPPVADGVTLPSGNLRRFSSGQFNRVPVLIGMTRDEGNIGAALSAAQLGREMTVAEYRDALARLADGAPAPVVSLLGSLYSPGRYGSTNWALGAFLTDVLFAAPIDRTTMALWNRTPLYAYEFGDRTAPSLAGPDGPPIGAFHGSELPYLFATRHAALTTDAHRALARQMRQYWGNFAATRDPNRAPSTASPRMPAWPRFDPISTPYRNLRDGGRSGTLSFGQFQARHQTLLWNTLDILGG